MKHTFRKEVSQALSQTSTMNPGLINESDLSLLPQIVREYLKNAGWIGKNKLLNVRIVFEGRFRFKPGQSWMKFSSVQYNFFDIPTRIFLMKASKMGIPATGLHIYKDKQATMVIKIASLFKVVDAKGPEMNHGETLMVFNDMCCMAPATLIEKNIQWEVLDPLTVRAKFTNGNLSVTSDLFFNDYGELVNFKSNDKYESTDGKTYRKLPWSTPIIEYKVIDGIKMPSFAQIIFHKPEGDFCYGEFNLKDIEFNCQTFKNLDL
jgi:hypothetical protein